MFLCVVRLPQKLNEAYSLVNFSFSMDVGCSRIFYGIDSRNYRLGGGFTVDCLSSLVYLRTKLGICSCYISESTIVISHLNVVN